jgi:aminopeptidase N
MRRFLLLAISLLASYAALQAQGPEARSYHLRLNIEPRLKTLRGSCELVVGSATPFNDSLVLDLLGLKADSVRVNGDSGTFNLRDGKLRIPLRIDGQSDADTLQIWYGGSPQTDATWGGFYFSGNYAWNMGVAFTSNPHPFGRCWFPCFDRFDDKAFYRFDITCDSALSAICNGNLQQVIDTGGGKRTFRWVMNEPMPTYLASVAIAPYTRINGTLSGMQGGIPYRLAAEPKDTANLRKSFANLQQAFTAFEEAYGKHRFGQVGFNTVPFNAGAMEHTGNIAYPLYAVNGTLAQETLMAHELSHHWWGNNVTCKRPEDMWLNEGWASYSEKLFTEKVYGTKAYFDAMKGHHADVLRLAHAQDDIPLPVSGIGHEHTYGTHVYKKGASMVHTLRWWMGDKNWRDACTKLQDSFAYGNISTDTMQSLFTRYSFFSLQPFFSQWVKMGGFPGLKIARMQKRVKDGRHYATVLLVQQSRFNYHTYTDFPVWIRWIAADGRAITTLHTVRQAVQEIESPALAFEPVYAELDPNDKLSLARTHTLLRIMDSSISLPYEYASVNCRGAADTVIIDVDHQWVGAGTNSGNTDRARPSHYRHWIVGGNWPGKAAVDLTFEYDGRKSAASRTGYLDHSMIPGTEDSLVLLYRANHFQAWRRVWEAEFNKGNRFDKAGTVLVRNAIPGEYVLANSDPLMSGVSALPMPIHLRSFPNPAGKRVTMTWDIAEGCQKELVIYDQRGREVGREQVSAGKQSHQLNLESLPPGMYVVELASPCIEGHMQTMVVKGE